MITVARPAKSRLKSDMIDERIVRGIPFRTSNRSHEVDDSKSNKTNDDSNQQRRLFL